MIVSQSIIYTVNINQGCIFTLFTTLAKSTNCLMYAYRELHTFTHIGFSVLAIIQIMFVELQCIILSIIVATAHFKVG